jgi:hypothetical protein
MRTLAGSIVALSGAIMLGAGQLARAIALSGKWDDTPVSMRIIGPARCGQYRVAYNQRSQGACRREVVSRLSAFRRIPFYRAGVFLLAGTGGIRNC